MRPGQHLHINRPDPRLILFGIGNCGRCDDGLGWAFLDQIEQEGTFRGQLEYRYQLQIEDAALIRDAERVVFVDSHRGSLPGGWSWQPCEASADFEFTTHTLAPQAVLFLCQNLYGKHPHAEVLMIEGVKWDLANGLSGQATQHLRDALRFYLGTPPGIEAKERGAAKRTLGTARSAISV